MESIHALTRNAFTVSSVNYEQVTEENDSEVVSTNRQRTDLPFLIVHGLFFFLMIFFISYCAVFGDIERLTVGYDKCGYVCGKRNYLDFDFQTNCKGDGDMRYKPFLDVVAESCVHQCDYNSLVIGRRCFPSSGRIPTDLLSDIAKDLHSCSSELIGLSFLAVGFAFIMFLILRYMTAAFVWTTLFGVVVVCATLTGYFWYLTDYTHGIEPVAIFLSIFTVIILLVILVLRKRIELVIQLLKEAGKAISAIPVIVLQPLLTISALGLTLCAWVYFILVIESAGIPKESFRGITFHQNGIINFSRWFNLFVMLWMVQFIYGCQSMTMAGAVSKWYFTRNKAMLNSPLWNSFRNTILYHLGTISLGSLIIALIQMLRILVRLFRRYIRYPLYLCCMCCIFAKIETCLNYLEDLVKYLTRNAYIVTAIYGTGFIESGTKAFKLLFENVLRVIAINSVGDFVLFLAKVLVVVSSVLVGLAVLQNKPNVDNVWAVLLVLGAVALLIGHCFLTVYEIAVDTVFICFCEDCNMNDGMARPYYMSHSLMEFVEKSRVVLNVKDAEANTNNTGEAVVT